MDRRKIATLLVVLFTVVLAGVAVFTAFRLYQNRQQPVAPTAPTSIPRAQEATPTPTPTPSPATSCEVVSFSIAGPVCGDTCSTSDANSCPTDNTCSATTNKCVLTACTVAGASCDANNCTLTSSTPTPTATPTPTPGPACGDTCTSNAQCPTDHVCSTGGQCVLSACLQSGATCNSTNCQLVQATTAPELPQAGTGMPTIIAGILGVLAIIGALALAL